MVTDRDNTTTNNNKRSTYYELQKEMEQTPQIKYS